MKHAFLIRVFCPICFVVVFFSASGSAQPLEKPDVHLRFLFLDETAGAYLLKTGTSYQQLSASPYAISPVITAKAGTPLEIFKDLPATENSAVKIVRTSVATFTPTEGINTSLVVLTPRPVPASPATHPTYDISIFDSDPATFPAKSIRIINLDRVPMAAMFGDKQIVTPPGSAAIVSPSTDRLDRVFCKIAMPSSAGWKLLYDKVTIVRPDGRITGIFVYSPSGLRHTYSREEIAQNGLPPAGHFWLTYEEIDLVGHR